MSYYEQLLDACHRELKRYYEHHGKSYQKMAEQLNAGSPETLRRIERDDYRNHHPLLQTLEDLKKALNIRIPEYNGSTGLSSAAQGDLNSVANFFGRFDQHQRDRVLRRCEEVDEDREYYEAKGSGYAAGGSRTLPYAADTPASYGSSPKKMKNSKPGKKSSGKEKPDHPEKPSDRKTD